MNRREILAAFGGMALLGGCSAPRDGRHADWESTLIATWRSPDPTTRMTLQWVTEGNTGSVPVELTGNTVELRETTTRSTTFGGTDYLRVRAEFTDLEPDSRYRIAIDGADTGLEVRTAPTTLSKPVTFAQGGDVGTAEVVPDLHRQAAGWEPLFGLVGGDLAYANGEQNNVGLWIQFLRHWHKFMRSGDRLIPIVAAIGNHEVVGGMHGTPTDAPFYYSLFDNTVRDHAYWAMDFGEYLSILILDSNHSTPVPGEQTAWFERALADRETRQHLMVAYHVPAYPSAKPIEGAGRDRIDIRRHWVPLLQDFAVDVAFEHDDHTYKRTHPLDGDEEDSGNGVLYLGDGAWGRGPRTVEDRDYLAASKNSLNVIRVQISDGTQRYRAVDPSGNVIDQFTRTTQ